MNDPHVTADALEELVSNLKHANSVFERAALFSAIRQLCDDILNEDEERISGYAQEKAGQIRWHSAAALGFDITNGQPVEQHRVWALGAVSSLRDSLPKRAHR